MKQLIPLQTFVRRHGFQDVGPDFKYFTTEFFGQRFYCLWVVFTVHPKYTGALYQRCFENNMAPDSSIGKIVGNINTFATGGTVLYLLRV